MSGTPIFDQLVLEFEEEGVDLGPFGIPKEVEDSILDETDDTVIIKAPKFDSGEVHVFPIKTEKMRVHPQSYDFFERAA